MQQPYTSALKSIKTKLHFRVMTTNWTNINGLQNDATDLLSVEMS